MIFKHLLKLIFLKLPVQIAGIFILPFVCMRYRLGEFPKTFIWFDDIRGRLIAEHGIHGRDFGVQHFGSGHMDLFYKYNHTWYSRYIWSAFRNAVNYFQHRPLGMERYDVNRAFQYYGTKHIGGKVYIRYNIGYKMFSKDHMEHMASINLPLQYVFSIGVRVL